MNNAISRKDAEKLNKETLVKILLMLQLNFDEEKMEFTDEELIDIRKTIAEAPCFNEAECAVVLAESGELEEPTLEEVRPKKSKKTKGKRTKDLEGLPQAEPIISELNHEV